MNRAIKVTRRLFRFSLRTMLIVVGAFAIWLGMQAHWVNQRREYLKQYPSAVPVTPAGARQTLVRYSPVPTPEPPGFLWLWKEEGVGYLCVESPGLLEQRVTHRNEPSLEAARARKLFPEAIIEVYDGSEVHYLWKPGERWAWSDGVGW